MPKKQPKPQHFARSHGVQKTETYELAESVTPMTEVLLRDLAALEIHVTTTAHKHHVQPIDLLNEIARRLTRT